MARLAILIRISLLPQPRRFMEPTAEEQPPNG